MRSLVGQAFSLPGPFSAGQTASAAHGKEVTFKGHVEPDGDLTIVQDDGATLTLKKKSRVTTLPPPASAFARSDLCGAACQRVLKKAVYSPIGRRNRLPHHEKFKQMRSLVGQAFSLPGPFPAGQTASSAHGKEVTFKGHVEPDGDLTIVQDDGATLTLKKEIARHHPAPTGVGIRAE